MAKNDDMRRLAEWLVKIAAKDPLGQHVKLLGVGFGVFLVILWIYTLLKSGFGPSFNLAVVFSLGLFFLTKRYGTRLLRAKEGKLQPDFNDSRLYFIAGRALKLFTLSMISSYAAMLVVSVFSS